MVADRRGQDRSKGAMPQSAARVRRSGCRIPILAIGPLFAVAALAFGLADAAAVETDAPRAMIVESDTGSILYAKNTGVAFAPGNFAKLMTAAVVLDALAAGEIREDTLYTVTEHAWRTGGAPARVTTMFAAVKSRVAVSDLLKGLIVSYGNDAAIALAEGMAGSEAAFADRMNALAARIGMTGSRFANPTGYADPASRITLDDLDRLVRHIRAAHPDGYALYRLEEFAWNRITQLNKTTPVRTLPGTDGLVLAFDEAAGFGAAVSTVREGRRMFVALSGLKNADARDREIKALVDGAYEDFETVTLFPEGATVGSVRVFGGTLSRVGVTGRGAVAVTLPKAGRDEFRARVAYDGPVPAPIARGQEVARLEIRNEDRLYQSVPLVAETDVAVGDLPARARDGLMELLFGWW